MIQSTVRFVLIKSMLLFRFTVLWFYLYQEYLFFPAKSRLTFKGVENDDAMKLEKRSNEVVKNDLDISKIRPWFGDPGEGLSMILRTFNLE